MDATVPHNVKEGACAQRTQKMFNLRRINNELHVIINVGDGTEQAVAYATFWSELDQFIQEISSASEAVTAFAQAGKKLGA